MSRARNSHTPEEAMAMECPERFTLSPAERKCLGTGCMHWLWAWFEDDGFETHTERSMDWGELANDAEGLQAYLAVVLGDQAKAKDLADRWTDTPDSEEEALEEIADEINAALEEAFMTKPAEGGPSKLEAFVETRRPEGEGWGSEGGEVGDGMMHAAYQRPARRRGFCGRLASAHG